MKKKLVLHRNTVRVLSATDLSSQAAGGRIYTLDERCDSRFCGPTRNGDTDCVICPSLFTR